MRELGSGLAGPQIKGSKGPERRGEVTLAQMKTSSMPGAW